MQINLLPNPGNAVIKVIPKGRFLLEFLQDSKMSGGGLRLRLYHPESNMVEEIGKNLFITPWIEIQNAIWESEDFYFPAVQYQEGRAFKVDIYKYISRTRTFDIVYSFEDTGRLSEKGTRFKIFVLSETVFLLQKEVLESAKTELRMGHIRFEQKLVDLETKEEYEVKDENLNNNGLTRIIAISPTQVLTKTGCSYLEDNRFSTRSETDALIESVFIHTTSRFIADLSIGADTIDAYLLSSAYYRQYILTPELKEDYIYYMIVNPDEGSSVSVFYNVITNEQLSCKNEMLDMDDLDINVVIGNTPYVKNTAMLDTRFLNLKTMDFDLPVMGLEYVSIIGDLFVLKSYKHQKEGVLEFYRYPDMKRILAEKGESLTGCKKNDDYYLYIYKK